MNLQRAMMAMSVVWVIVAALTWALFQFGLPAPAKSEYGYAAFRRGYSKSQRLKFLLVVLFVQLVGAGSAAAICYGIAIDDEQVINSKVSPGEKSLASALTSALSEVAELRERTANCEVAKNEAYAERNKLVALLARIFPSGIRSTAIPGWDPEWHGCVYIHTPVGQMSWHYHDSESYMFDRLPPYEKQWDGHTNAEKYERVGALTKRLGSAESRRWQDLLWYAK